MKNITIFFILFLLLCPVSYAASIYQDTNRFSYGFMRIMRAPFQLPYYLLRGTFTGPLVMGTVGGALQGTFSTVNELVGGVFDMGAAAAPYAKYAAFAA